MKQFILHSWILCLLVVMTGCSKDDAGAVDSAQSPIEFTTDGPAHFITRSVIDDLNDLKESDAGFGVLAYYTDTYTWDLCDGSGDVGHTSKVAPNFMYNQQVKWSTDHWTYSPVKYWPNDNNPADDGGATGSQTKSYVSFFAYAPYNGTGIALSNNTATGAPTVTYTWEPENDFLYAAPLLDRYKYDDSGDANDDGRIGDAVSFTFQHALALVNFKVRRSSATWYDVKVKNLTVSGFYGSGTFDLGTSSWTPIGERDQQRSYSYNKNVSADIDLMCSWLMIPATSTPPANVLSYTITYTIGPKENTKTDYISLTSYEMGNQYNIIFNIDSDGIIVETTKFTEQW